MPRGIAFFEMSETCSPTPLIPLHFSVTICDAVRVIKGAFTDARMGPCEASATALRYAKSHLER